MVENQTRGGLPLSAGCGVPRADCRADAVIPSTMIQYDNQRQYSFGGIGR